MNTVGALEIELYTLKLTSYSEVLKTKWWHQVGNEGQRKYKWLEERKSSSAFSFLLLLSVVVYMHTGTRRSTTTSSTTIVISYVIKRKGIIGSSPTESVKFCKTSSSLGLACSPHSMLSPFVHIFSIRGQILAPAGSSSPPSSAFRLLCTFFECVHSHNSTCLYAVVRWNKVNVKWTTKIITESFVSPHQICMRPSLHRTDSRGVKRSEQFLYPTFNTCVFSYFTKFYPHMAVYRRLAIW